MKLLTILLLLLCMTTVGCSKDFFQPKDNQTLSQKLEDCQTTVVELEQNKVVGLDKNIRWLITASIVGIGSFIVLSFVSLKLGILGATGCSTVLGLSLMTSIHSVLLAWIFLGIFLFGLGSIVYYVYGDRKTIKEIILSAEKWKDNKFDDVKEEVKNFQSDRTKSIVDKILK